MHFTFGFAAVPPVQQTLCTRCAGTNFFGAQSLLCTNEGPPAFTGHLSLLQNLSHKFVVGLSQSQPARAGDAESSTAAATTEHTPRDLITQPKPTMISLPETKTKIGFSVP
ncbi:MAG: hypothetical protein FJ144_02030 [Deltaproteobacteria bacterium]|nr:hypothetical protein [Deltaproteobacteria bacterium]